MRGLRYAAMMLALGAQPAMAQLDDTELKRAMAERAALPPPPPPADTEADTGDETIDFGETMVELRKAGDPVAEAIRRWGPGDRRVTLALRQHAFDLFEDARFDEAEVLFRRIVAQGPARDIETRFAEGKLAETLLRLGRYDEAAARFAELVKREEPEPSHVLLVHLGSALVSMGRNAEADAVFARVLKMAPGDRWAQNQLAHFYGRAGRFADALPYAQRVLDEDLATTERSPFALGWELVRAKHRFNVAVPLLGLGRVKEAAALLEACVEPARAALDARHPDLALLLLMLARAHVLDDNPAALAEAREAAGIVRRLRDARLRGEAAGKGADASSAALARAVAGDAKLRDPLAGAYAALAGAAWNEAQRSPANMLALLDEAFVAAQDLDRSAAGEAMGEAAARAVAGTGPLGSLVERKQALAAQVRTLARGNAPDAAKLAALSAELAAIDAQIGRDFPDYAQLVAPGSLTVAQVQARLAADEALLFVVPVADDVFTFAIGKTTARWSRRAGGSAETRRRVERVRCRIDEAACVSPADLDPTPDGAAPLEGIDAYFPRYDRATAHALYRDLIGPVAPVLAGKTVFATVDGPLSGLPLAALPVAPPADAAPLNDGAALLATPWFGAGQRLIALPVVSALRPRTAAVRGTGGGFVGYGAPTLEGSPATTRGVGGRTRFRGRGATVAAVDPASLRMLAPLPGTRVELEAMAASLRLDGSAVHLGDAATEWNVRNDNGLAGARVIAFATHGVLPSEVSGLGEPGLVFTPPKAARPGDDGLLTASEAAQLRLSSDWLILSACNTASTDGTPGAGSLSSLSRAFLYAGTRGLLASHWRVSDEVSAALTVEALRARMAPGVTRAEALRSAIEAVRTGRRADGSAVAGWASHWAHPAAWAPFTLIAASND